MEKNDWEDLYEEGEDCLEDVLERLLNGDN
jgi:hypothetical protein